ncbi:MAG: MerR family transcriptional regulator [Clostridia bacterium]|nr:MerR family transcriptional regulator [Clostridia bacterium]
MLYTVGEMSKMLEIPTSTLRYYDKEGLLPFVERSKSGIRMFKEADYEWLQVINCLKKAGMSLKDIKNYIYMAMEGDKTIDERLSLFQKQKKAIEDQISELQETLNIVNFKCWYYEKAKEAGTTSVPRNMPVDEIPQEYRSAREKLRNIK